MSKINELIDSLTNENVEDVKQQLKSEASAKDKTNRQLYVRAKKAEGFTQEKDGKWIKKQEPKKEEPKKQDPKSKKEPEKPNESDYKEMVEDTYLNAKGFTLDKQKEFIRKEAENTGKPFKEVLDFKYVNEKLDNIKSQHEAEAGMPQGGGKSTGKGKQDVDYWLAKGGVPEDNLELANKVIEARMKKEREGNMFSKDLF